MDKGSVSSWLPSRRLFDYVVVTGPATQPSLLQPLSAGASSSNLFDGQFKAVVLSRFPRINYTDFLLPPLVPMFTHPRGVDFSLADDAASVDQAPNYVAFVLTEANGDNVYGGALQFRQAVPNYSGHEPKVVTSVYSVCLLSHYPFYTVLQAMCHRILDHVTSGDAETMPVERVINNVMLEIPLPPLGQTSVIYKLSNVPGHHLLIARPPPERLPLLDIPVRLLLQTLNPINICTVLAAMLSESKVLFVSSNYVLTTYIIETLVALLFPFRWRFVYVPVLPPSLTDFVHAPTPYVMGVHSKDFMALSSRRELGNDRVIVVNLDQDAVTSTLNETRDKRLPEIPEPYHEALLGFLELHANAVAIDDDDAGSRGSRRAANLLARVSTSSRRQAPAGRSSSSGRRGAVGTVDAAAVVVGAAAAGGGSKRKTGGGLLSRFRKSRKAAVASIENLNAAGMTEQDFLLNETIRQGVLHFFASWLFNYDNFLVYVKDDVIVFNKASFLKSHLHPSVFLDEFLDTEMFSYFIETWTESFPNAFEQYLDELSVLASNNDDIDVLPPKSDWRRDLTGEFVVPAPDTSGLKKPKSAGKKDKKKGKNAAPVLEPANAHLFPTDLEPSLFGKPRMPKPLISPVEKQLLERQAAKRGKSKKRAARGGAGGSSGSRGSTGSARREAAAASAKYPSSLRARLNSMENQASRFKRTWLRDPRRLSSGLQASPSQSTATAGLHSTMASTMRSTSTAPIERPLETRESTRALVLTTAGGAGGEVQEEAVKRRMEQQQRQEAEQFLRLTVHKVFTGQPIDPNNTARVFDHFRNEMGRSAFLSVLEGEKSRYLPKEAFKGLLLLLTEFLREADLVQDFRSVARFLDVINNYYTDPDATGRNETAHRHMLGLMIWNNMRFWDEALATAVKVERRRLYAGSFRGHLNKLQSEKSLSMLPGIGDAAQQAPASVRSTHSNGSAGLRTVPRPGSARMSRDRGAGSSSGGRRHGGADSAGDRHGRTHRRAGSRPRVGAGQQKTAGNRTLSRTMSIGVDVDRAAVREDENLVFSQMAQYAHHMQQLGVPRDTIDDWVQKACRHHALSEEHQGTLQALLDNMARAEMLDTNPNALPSSGTSVASGSSGGDEAKSVSNWRSRVMAARKNFKTPAQALRDRRMRKAAAASAVVPALGASQRVSPGDGTVTSTTTDGGWIALLMSGHTEGIPALAYREPFIISGSCDSSLRIWNVHKSACVAALRGHTGWVSSVAIDNKHIVSGSFDKTIKLWDLAATTLVDTLTGHDGDVFCLKAASNVILSGSYDNTVRIWDTRKPTAPTAVLAEHAGPVTDLDRDGHTVVTGSRDTSVKQWDLRKPSESLITYIGHTDWIKSVRVWQSHILSASHDHTLRLWNAATLKFDRTLAGHRGSINAAAAQGNQVVSAGADGLVKIWSVSTGKCTATLHGHEDEVSTVAIEGDTIVSGSFDGSVRVWSAEQRVQVAKLAGHSQWVSSLVVRNGRVLSGSWDGAVRMWYR